MRSLMRRRALLAAGALAGMAAMLPRPAHAYAHYSTDRVMKAPRLEPGERVWQWLVLLIDASSSMRQLFEQRSFYDLQIEATAHALAEPCVADRLIGTSLGRTALAAILWSARRQQQIAIHWTVIRGQEDIAAFVRRLRHTANYLDSFTGVAAAVRFALEHLQAEYVSAATRRIIDVSANGRDNQEGDPSSAAREAETLGITINAVVMRGYDGTADQIYDYYARNVVTKDGFVVKVKHEADSLAALATATTTKLCAELS
jgi:hypothetical protein